MLGMDRWVHTRNCAIRLLFDKQMLKKLPPLCNGCDHYAKYGVTQKGKNEGRAYYTYVQAPFRCPQ